GDRRELADHRAPRVLLRIEDEAAVVLADLRVAREAEQPLLVLDERLARLQVEEDLRVAAVAPLLRDQDAPALLDDEESARPVGRLLHPERAVEVELREDAAELDLGERLGRRGAGEEEGEEAGERGADRGDGGRVHPRESSGGAGLRQV